jgi:hypothetical protein
LGLLIASTPYTPFLLLFFGSLCFSVLYLFSFAIFLLYIFGFLFYISFPLPFSEDRLRQAQGKKGVRQIWAGGRLRKGQRKVEKQQR